jgi:hypothetical protein
LVKIRIIGTGTDGLEYTNDNKLDDYGCIAEYKEKPSGEQLTQDIAECLLYLQFDLPYGVSFVGGRYEVIEGMELFAKTSRI